MTALAWWLFGVALVDLFRARSDVSTSVRRLLLSAGGAAFVLVGAVTAHPQGGFGWTAWVTGAVLVGLWVFGSGSALAGRPRATGAVVGYGALATGLVVLGAAGTRAGTSRLVGRCAR